MAVKSHIAVLQGGWSPERKISLISGQKCAEALQRSGYKVTQIDVDRDLAGRLIELAPDICFNALHGVGGEDGEVQGLLEVLAIPYTHSGVRASALAMDKHLSKKIFADAGLPVAPSVLVMRGTCTDHPLEPPYVVKPVNQGSSVGVQIVPNRANNLPDTLTEAGWGFDSAAMVEAYIAGRELTCAVLDDAPTDVMEIVPTNGFYDYRAKYEDGGSAHILPADIPAALLGEIQAVTLMAHRVLGCRGVTRADFRFDPDEPTLALLEINTQPGMTPLSLVPEMAEARGMSYDKLVTWIAEDASCPR